MDDILSVKSGADNNIIVMTGTVKLENTVAPHEEPNPTETIPCYDSCKWDAIFFYLIIFIILYK